MVAMILLTILTVVQQGDVFPAPPDESIHLC